MEATLHILFVCSGNTCRSVMAEALFRRLWETDGSPEVKVEVSSAGLATTGGQPASRDAMELLRVTGLSMLDHRSRPVTAALLEKADFIFTMTATHKKFINDYFPGYKDKVWTLGEFGGAGADIADPYGAGMDAYQLAAAQIKQALGGVLIRLGKNKQ